MLLLVLLGLLFAGPSRDAALLSSEDWPEREAAHGRLESASWRSWPALWFAEGSGDPEAARRARTLLSGPRCDARAACSRGLVLCLIYAPLAPETWQSLERYGPEQRWLHEAVFDYAVDRGFLTAAERQRYHQGVAWFWPGEAFCRRLWLVRVRAGTEHPAPCLFLPP